MSGDPNGGQHLQDALAMFPPGSYPYGAAQAAAAAAAAQYAAAGGHQLPNNASGSAAASAPPPPGGGVIHQHATDESMREFWQAQMIEVQGVGTNTEDFKNHQLPLARIKKIMKSDEDVRMISAEAPVLFARACETFVLELTLRAWRHAEENKRRTLQRNDVAAAITRTDVFDFLVDIVPREDRAAAGPGPGDGGGAGGAAGPSAAGGGGGGGASGGSYWPGGAAGAGDLANAAAAAAAAAAAGGGVAVDPAMLQAYYQSQAAAAAAAAAASAQQHGGGGQ